MRRKKLQHVLLETDKGNRHRDLRELGRTQPNSYLEAMLLQKVADIAVNYHSRTSGSTPEFLFLDDVIR